jgi:chromate transporter
MSDNHQEIQKPSQPCQQGSAWEVFYTFLKLGLTSFGGPVAHIGYFRKELLERRKWVTENQFAQLFAICQFIPGPASSQLGFALGLLRAGWRGALLAFIAFTLPSALLMIGFATSLSLISGEVGQAVVHGLKIVACAIVADAVIGMASNLCSDLARRLIAIIAIGLVLLIDSIWGQMLTILFGATAGILSCKVAQAKLQDVITVNYSARFGLVLFAIFAALLVLFSSFNAESQLFQSSKAFYQAGALVFGGGHVVLPLLQDSIVGAGWVNNNDFLAGYGAAQAIPGPMFTFAGYLGALLPFETSVGTNAILALLFMFLPGFLLVLIAMPLWQSIASNRKMLSVIAGVNASVVGILAAALYDPIFTAGIGSVMDAVIAVIGFVVLRVFKRSPLWVVVWCVTASLLVFMI